MSDPMTMKWAIVDLIRVLDTAYGGQLHTELARIARTLGVELTDPVASPAATRRESWSEDPVKWERDRAFEQQADAFEQQAEVDKRWKTEQERKMKAPRVKGVS